MIELFSFVVKNILKLNFSFVVKSSYLNILFNGSGSSAYDSFWFNRTRKDWRLQIIGWQVDKVRPVGGSRGLEVLAENINPSTQPPATQLETTIPKIMR